MQSCAKAGYKYTAKFPPIDGKPYQDAKKQVLDFYIPLLQSCSPYSSLILCSLYLPKCVEGVDRPVVPCRSVCLSFVRSCMDSLRLASMGGMFTSFCDLLPKENSTPGKCLLPDNFVRPPVGKKPRFRFCY